MAYVTPRNYYRGREKRLRLIVIHTMESPENDDTAENVAAWFAGPDAPLASAHACIDNNSVVLCLPPSDTAWAAPGANADGYQIEQAGRAAQGIDGWSDAYSQSMLRLSAAHARQIAQQAGIPLVHLTDAQLAAGQAGFVGHDQVSRVYRKSDHTDPGPTFPWDQYMRLAGGQSEEDDMPSAQEIAQAVWNFDIGSAGKFGQGNEPAWRHLSWAHEDGAQMRKGTSLDTPLTDTDGVKGSIAQRIPYVDARIRSLTATTTAQAAALKALAEAKGIDAGVLEGIVTTAVQASLVDLSITLTTKEN